jgi:type I restriction enzyme M protein
MLTGEIRSQIDQIWNAFWSGGISNPLEVIEQITYLLFLKRLDEQEIAEELKANREKKPMQKHAEGPRTWSLRWSQRLPAPLKRPSRSKPHPGSQITAE